MGGPEAVVILVLAFLLIGPERLPEVLAKARHWIREARRMADGARGQLREQMGPEFDDIDWKAYDPRQYDPRRIVREALTEPFDDPAGPSSPGDDPGVEEEPRYRPPAVFDPAKPVPFDTDAT
ncbi:Sec-independent protein translocase protein TatB [Mobilicoccus pelagius NBRC 104925]|uniref:Sec-independent protein translocase protein TatB n=1 Tax=Mobilicoccus pelagius NBRC 104925 TaxID=1089455 RepID=H5URN3_9MICO|nr:Sec-independent protein translocase protein TatB [Mobilicoccus pelagius NBRC 104925]